ncbi:MAG: hypothetical protein HOO19_04085 [Rhodospirillaceae bacterium]|jgi:hypothetical protein|nr:hypothetical protein [Rhodospirillaceae bacterium]MBT4116257.1 hypothetical protein [Rhodospirillaceae bacterium]MBT4673921.1 hypothetical protein [Rhodospirillaceae bacterium]MBT4719971.1 hypothetical protein [Rhodospirillaceae bacterium]MBT4748485.1 hypothetical protein [Rhodospirillaceae bacterium]
MAEEPVAAKKGASFKPILWGFMFTVAMVSFPGLVLLVVVGLVPTFVAFMVDKAPKKYLAFCVAGMNLSGVFPAMIDLWQGANDIKAAVNIITNVFELTVMYAAAAFGWLIYMAIPPVVAALMAVAAQQRIMQLRASQREMINEWGQDIAQGYGGATIETGGKPTDG